MHWFLLGTSNNRHIYSSEELGVKKYAESRKTVEHAIANHAFFKQHFRKQLLNMEFSLTHLEYGLKNLTHIISNTPSDVSLLKDALRTWLQRRNEQQGDKYRFDTVVLRAFYYLNMPNEAIRVSLKPFRICSLNILKISEIEFQNFCSFLLVF